MTKCVDCRVRHLHCNNEIPCQECEKSGRDCRRMSVRFKHLVCPARNATRADYGKYEFFFECEQPWVDLDGIISFAGDSKDISGVLSLEAPDKDDSNASDLERGTPLDINPSATPTSSKVTYLDEDVESTPGPRDDPPDYAAAVEHIPHDPHIRDTLRGEPNNPDLAMPVLSTGISSLNETQSASESAWPLKSLKERNLFQHFVTHLAPWVCPGSYQS